MSKLSTWIEEYMIVLINTYDKEVKAFNLIKVFNERSLYEEANRLAKKLIVELETPPISLEDLDRIHRIYYLLYYSDNPLKFDIKYKLFNRLIESKKVLVNNRLSLYEVEMFNYGDVRKVDFTKDIEWIDGLRDFMEKHSNSDLLDALYDVVSYTGEQPLHYTFELVKRRLDQNNDDLFRYAVTYLYNYAHRYYAKGLTNDIELIKEIIDLGLSSNAFMSQGYIPVIRFHNLVNSMAALLPYEDVQVFIDKWYNRVDSNFLESTQKLAIAQNAFYHKKYYEILPLLRNLKVDDLFQKLKLYNLLLVGIYKADSLDYELLHNTALNFKRMLRTAKDKLSSKAYNSNYNFTKVMEKLANRDFDKGGIDLGAYPSLMYRKWLIDEVN